MDAKLVSNYLSKLKEKSGLTYEAISKISGVPEATVKNIITGKTERPGIDIVSDLVFPLGGSLDEMSTGKSKDQIKEFSIESIKEMYEFQLAEYKATEEAHINNIRAHYEQHRDDVTRNYEMRLEDKREIIKEKNKQLRLWQILAGMGFGILIILLILEVSNPNLGWIKF